MSIQYKDALVKVQVEIDAWIEELGLGDSDLIDDLDIDGLAAAVVFALFTEGEIVADSPEFLRDPQYTGRWMQEQREKLRANRRTISIDLVSGQVQEKAHD